MIKAIFKKSCYIISKSDNIAPKKLKKKETINESQKKDKLKLAVYHCVLYLHMAFVRLVAESRVRNQRVLDWRTNSTNFQPYMWTKCKLNPSRSNAFLLVCMA
ncbi:hypothetical protein AVEN_122904-1 [Araneus ventricosus]|uniref:Uncharacterized protein n=1 Tax=Araneus ventricosus TaxID=182803 RepID=A0A4Y2MTE9_ARAVE|nr:hypothetical protein AVEN_122904-1 [Araneus ventricosus]